MAPRRRGFDAADLEVFRTLLESVPEEMGLALARSAHSPNIKERRDFSCALFGGDGALAAQAAHIPVHLGAMPRSVTAALAARPLGRGEVVVLNDPYHGGTHLPDITLVSAVVPPGARRPLAYLASRAHHADVGGGAPGSLALATEIFQEGFIIPPVYLARRGELQADVLDLVCANSRTPDERRGDLHAQLAAHARGAERLTDLAGRYGAATLRRALRALDAYSARMARAVVRALPRGEFRFADALDDDGLGSGPVAVVVTLRLTGEAFIADFTGCAPQVAGPVNAVLPVTESAVFYGFRCLFDESVPLNAGCFAPVQVMAPPGTVVNARPPAAVAGGNVELSQRIVDVVFGALAQAVPDRIPAASAGTMSNLTIGSTRADGPRFAYYETIAGGHGGAPQGDGLSGTQAHMTNTMNTPVEALEAAYPLRVVEYALRERSGGRGTHGGGDGLRRTVEALAPCRATLLTDRRVRGPYGLQGGAAGAPGTNAVHRAGGAAEGLPGKCTVDLAAGDRLVIETPGGGGWGNA